MVRPDLVFVIGGGQRGDYLHVSSDILLRTDPHRNLIQNQDVAGASRGDVNVP